MSIVDPLALMAEELARAATGEEFYAECMSGRDEWVAYHEMRAALGWACFATLTMGTTPICRTGALAELDAIVRAARLLLNGGPK